MKQKPTHKPPNKPATRPLVKKEIKKATLKPFFLDFYLEKYGLWITLGLVFLLILVIFQDFIFGNSLYLFKDIGSDSLNMSYPNWVCASKYLRNNGFPLWSFSQGMGQNILWPALMDVFLSIVYFVNPGNIAGTVIWMEIAKILVTAVLIYHFLKLWKLSNFIALLGTLFYCFGGFMIVGGSWFQFSTEACYLAFLLLAFERLFRNDSWGLFPVAIALITIFQPFNLYFYGLFLIFYFLFRFFSSEDPAFKKFIVLVCKMGVLGLLGILMSGFVSLNTLQLLLDSPRVGGNSVYFNKLLAFPIFSLESKAFYTTAALRLFSNDMLGNGSNFKGWYNYLEAPLFYIGLLPLLLAPQIFLHLSNKKRIVYSIFFLVFFIPVIFPFFRYAFWFFTGDYFRGFSLFFSISLLIFSMVAFDRIVKGGKIQWVLLVVTAVVLLGMLYFPYPFSDQIISESIRSTARNFLIIYTILLILLNMAGLLSYIKYLILFLVIIEIGYLNFHTERDRVVLTRDEMKQKTGFNDFTVNAVTYIKDNDHGFFRLSKDYTSSPAIHASLNDAKVQGYFGTSSYHSFNQKYYIRFLEEMGIIIKGKEEQSRWAIGLMQEPLLLNLTSNKYQLATNPGSISFFKGIGYDSIGMFGNVTLLKNKNFIPLGFTYSKYISKSEFLKLSPVQKREILQQAFVAEEPPDPSLKVLKSLTSADTISLYTYKLYLENIASLKRDTFAISKFNEKHITGKISLDSTKFLFFSIPFDKGWNARINGKNVKPVLSNLGFMGFLLKPGQYRIELVYKPLYLTESIIVSVIALLVYFLLILLKQHFGRNKIIESEQRP